MRPFFTTSYPCIVSADLPADATMLDLRSVNEFLSGNVKTAKNITYTWLPERFDEVPSASPLHVHCGSGVRAAIGPSYLDGRGREVIHVDGPFAATRPK